MRRTRRNLKIDAMRIDLLLPDANRWLAPWRQWWRDESGVTAIEYGLLAALIFLAAIGSIAAFSDALELMYAEWTDAVLAAIG